MTNIHHHIAEEHGIGAVGWLRAAVLGANDGIVSTASLIVGIAAANASSETILTAGAAGLVAGAMSMAAGEYVSVSAQSDIEKADLAREKKEIEINTEGELKELASIYMKRGLESELAHKVAKQLMDHDALDAHARDELGIFMSTRTNPLQAALASGLAFSIGSMLPLAVVIFAAKTILIPTVFIVSLCSLALLGVVSAITGRAKVLRAVLRVSFWGALAMAMTAGIGTLLGIVV